MKFSIMDFFSKCDEIRSFLRIWSHLLKKSIIENFIFWAVTGINLKSQKKKEIKIILVILLWAVSGFWIAKEAPVESF